MLRRWSLPSFSGWSFWLLLAIALGLGVALGGTVSVLNKPLYAAAGLIGALAALICLMNAEIGLYILAAITYLRLSDVLVNFYHAPSIAKPFIALMMGIVVLRWMYYDAPPRNSSKTVLLVIAYGLAIFLSLFHAADLSAVQDALDDYWKNGIIAILVVMLLRDGITLRRVIWVLILAGAFMGSLSVWQYVTGTFQNPYWGFAIAHVQNIAGASSGYRIAGPIGDPNFYAQIMLVIIPLAFNRMLEEKQPALRFLALYATLVALMTVIFTFSRGAFLAVGLMTAIMFYFHPPKINELLFMLVLLLAVFPFVPKEYTDRLVTLNAVSSDVRSEVSLRGRTSEYMAAWMMFIDHPILGVGVGNYNAYYLDYSRKIGLDPRAENRSAHSLYLETAAELGLVGLGVLALILTAAFRSIFGAFRTLRNAGEYVYSELILSLGVGLAGYVTAAIFIHDAFPRYFWLLVGLALTAKEVARRATENSLGETLSPTGAK